MRFVYPIDVREITGPPAERGFAVSFPDLPEAITWGDTHDEALVHAVDCLEEAIAARIIARESLPPPSPAGRRPTVALGSLISAKAALYVALQERGLKAADLARRMKTQPSAITRLLDPRHASKLDQLDAALAALGKRLVISVEGAA